jgi:hypothetical protein
MARKVLLIVLLITPVARAEEPKKARPAAPTMEVRLSDGSHINVALLDEALPIQTPHGKLLVPLADIRRIDFGARLPEAVQKRIDAAIEDLGSQEMARRESAGEALLKIGPPAYPAVLRAVKSSDRERAISAKKLREQFTDAFAEQRLPAHDMDVIHTDDAKIAGRIEVSTLRVRTPHFGEKTLKIVDVASVRGAAAAIAEEKVAAQPDPGNLTNFASQTGKSFHFTVTGNTDGSIYGSDLYTTDSTLATAAVHAGLLRNGETGVLKVTIEPGAASYASTTRNGVTSYDWGQYHASYKVSRVKEAK